MSGARRRLIVVAVIENTSRHWLLCRMPSDRGVLPGHWALPGGGVEEGERLAEALAREVREELGIAVTNARPVTFKDAVRDKLYPDGRRETLHMVFVIYHCLAGPADIQLGGEFDAYRWIDPDALEGLSLDEMTLDTLLTVRRILATLGTPAGTGQASSP